MDLFVIHYPGLSQFTKSIKVINSYKNINNVNEDIIKEFNDNICVIYHNSKNYNMSLPLLKYIKDNKINSINQCDGIHTKNSDKIIYLKKILDNRFNELPNYLLFIDSGDTVLNILPFDEIMHKFHTYNCNILFNCDKVDFPYAMKIQKFHTKPDYFNIDYIKEYNIEKLYDNEDKRYINSGVYFGKKEDIKEFINICYDILMEHSDYQSDQFIFKLATKIINDKYGYHFADVDYNNLLFQISV